MSSDLLIRFVWTLAIIGAGLLVYYLVVRPYYGSASGTTNITNNGAAYLNNGLGTAVGISSNPITVNLAQKNHGPVRGETVGTAGRNTWPANATIILIILAVIIAVISGYGYKKFFKK